MQSTTSAGRADEGRSDHRVPCPDCDGHGEYVEPAPVYDARLEQWYPNYVEVPCARCEGRGHLDIDDPRRFG